MLLTFCMLPQRASPRFRVSARVSALMSSVFHEREFNAMAGAVDCGVFGQILLRTHLCRAMLAAEALMLGY